MQKPECQRKCAREKCRADLRETMETSESQFQALLTGQDSRMSQFQDARGTGAWPRFLGDLGICGNQKQRNAVKVVRIRCAHRAWFGHLEVVAQL